jgi:hypothetical protein
MMALLLVAALVVLGFLGWSLYVRFGSDRLGAINDRRRKTSRFVGRGEFVDGNRHLAVALALDGSTLFYENSDMQASVDLQWIKEIEYDTELATGTAVANSKVVRLRANSQTFEFVLPNVDVPQWHLMLPPRRAFVSASPIPPRVATA